MIRNTKSALLIILAVIISVFVANCQDKGSQPPESAQNLPPTVPVAVTPADGATGVTADFTLVWESTDPEGSPLQYDLYFGIDTLPTHEDRWSGNNTFASPWIPRENARQMLLQIYQMERAYRIQHNRYCLDGETARAGDSTFYNNLGIVIPLNDPYLYTISAPPVIFSCIATANLDFDLPIDAWTVNDWGEVVCVQNDVDIPLRVDIEYYWQVIAQDDRGQQTIGPVWRFQIDSIGFNLYPEMPRPISPADKSIIYSPDFIFQWESFDGDGEPLEYNFWLSRNPEFFSFHRLHLPIPLLPSPWKSRNIMQTVMQQVYDMETAYHSQYGTYCLNGATASRISDGFVPLDIVIDSLDIYVYTMTAATETFICVATADLDDDATVDTWTINQDGELACTIDDFLLLLEPYGTTYYWRVAARDIFGHTTVGPIWSFIIQE
jgi:hypothetical protein